jgi:hypothetical protein
VENSPEIVFLEKKKKGTKKKEKRKQKIIGSLPLLSPCPSESILGLRSLGPLPIQPSSRPLVHSQRLFFSFSFFLFFSLFFFLRLHITLASSAVQII